MSVSQTLTFGHAGASASLVYSATASGELATESNISVTANTTDQQENIVFNHTNLRALFIYSDVTVTLETNATNGSGGNTFTITAGIPLVWHYQSGITNPITAAVTTTYWTNATSGAANVYIRTLVA